MNNEWRVTSDESGCNVFAMRWWCRNRLEPWSIDLSFIIETAVMLRPRYVPLRNWGMCQMWNMHRCMCVSKYVYVCVYVCVYVYTCLSTCLSTCLYTHGYTHASIYTRLYKFSSKFIVHQKPPPRLTSLSSHHLTTTIKRCSFVHTLSLHFIPTKARWSTYRETRSLPFSIGQYAWAEQKGGESSTKSMDNINASLDMPHPIILDTLCNLDWTLNVDRWIYASIFQSTLEYLVKLYLISF